MSIRLRQGKGLSDEYYCSDGCYHDATVCEDESLDIYEIIDIRKVPRNTSCDNCGRLIKDDDVPEPNDDHDSDPFLEDGSYVDEVYSTVKTDARRGEIVFEGTDVDARHFTILDRGQSFHYRATRKTMYVGRDCPGATDPSARQGYYVDALSPEHAAMKMNERFPGETFTIQWWGKDE